MDRDSKILKNRIAQLRKEKHLSQSQLAKKTGLTRQAISLYEIGKREPKLKTWIKLANFFDVRTPYLQGISDNRELKENKPLSEFKTISLSAENFKNMKQRNKEAFDWLEGLENNEYNIKASKKLPKEDQEAIKTFLLSISSSNDHSGDYREILNTVFKNLIRLNNPEEKDD